MVKNPSNKTILVKLVISKKTGEDLHKPKFLKFHQPHVSTNGLGPGGLGPGGLDIWDSRNWKGFGSLRGTRFEFPNHQPTQTNN